MEFYEKIKQTVKGTENFRPTSTYFEKVFKSGGASENDYFQKLFD